MNEKMGGRSDQETPKKREVPPPYSDSESSPKLKVAERDQTPYHLEVADYCHRQLAENPAGHRRFQTPVDSFLYSLFTAGQDEISVDFVCPLAYSAHSIQTITPGSGAPKKILKIFFKLSEGTTETFNRAAVEFCNKIFSKSGQPLLINLSTSKIFGLSPVKGSQFARVWNSAFFLHVIQKAGQNLKWLLDSYLDEFPIPDWFSVPCFAIHSNNCFDYGLWAARTLTGLIGIDAAAELSFIPNGMTTARITAGGLVAYEVVKVILEKCARINASKLADAKLAELHWKSKLQGLVAKVDEILCHLNQRHEKQDISHADDMELGDQLMQIMEHGKDMVTVNCKAFAIYDAICQDLNRKAKSNMFLATAYLGVGGYFASVAHATVMSEMSVLTSIGIYLGLIETSVMGTLNTMLLTTTAGPIALAAVLGSVIWTGMSIDATLGRWKHEKKADCFRNVHNLISEVWKLSSESYSILVWVRCTDQGELVFVSDEARSAWAEWIARAKRHSNALPTSEDYSGQGLRNYLHERARQIGDWRTEINKLAT